MSDSLKVFQQAVVIEHIVLSIEESITPSWEVISSSLVGSEVMVSWPHLVEAKVSIFS